MVSEYLITPAPNPPRSTDNADWIAKAKALIRDMGAHAAIDSVGGALAEDLTALLGWEGVWSSSSPQRTRRSNCRPGR